MPIEKATLDAIALAYVEPMTSIRGRRVHRLLTRTFSGFDHVLRAIAEDGSTALFALAEAGGAALCQTDGRGPAAAIVEWSRLQGATVTTSYDLLKDSLPILHWTIWHPGFAGALTIPGTDLSPAEQSHIAAILRKLGT